MHEIFKEIDWNQIIFTIWSVLLLPVITYAGTQAGNYLKSKKLDKYADILYKNVTDAVKDVYETTVKDIKGTDAWTIEMQNKVKSLAKTKAVLALTDSACQILKAANRDFDEYLDGLVGSALYDLKNRKKRGDFS